MATVKSKMLQRERCRMQRSNRQPIYRRCHRQRGKEPSLARRWRLRIRRRGWKSIVCSGSVDLDEKNNLIQVIDVLEIGLAQEKNRIVLTTVYPGVGTWRHHRECHPKNTERSSEKLQSALNIHMKIVRRGLIFKLQPLRRNSSV